MPSHSHAPALVFFGIVFFALLCAAPAAADRQANGTSLDVHACYAPGTPMETVGRHQRMGQMTERYNYFPIIQFWPRTISWSVPADGLEISPAYEDESSDPNDLRAFLDGLYDSQATWLPYIQAVFDSWSEVTGIQFQYISNEDDCDFLIVNNICPCTGNSQRGDIRIMGHSIDGAGGTLGYAYAPRCGDVVLDTDDGTILGDSGNFFNTLAHELGHSLGLAHVCPVDETKLMEPFISQEFSGPQLDDIRGAQLIYGDSYEKEGSSNNNDALSSATPLGPMGAMSLSVIVPTEPDVHASVETRGTHDVDYYSFQLTGGHNFDLRLQATTEPDYLEGAQQGTACACHQISCVEEFPGSQLDVNMQLYDSEGTLLGVSNAFDTRETDVFEQISGTLLADTYYVAVYPNPGTASSDREQIYTLHLGLVTNSGATEIVIDDNDCPECEAAASALISWIGLLKAMGFYPL